MSAFVIASKNNPESNVYYIPPLFYMLNGQASGDVKIAAISGKMAIFYPGGHG